MNDSAVHRVRGGRLTRRRRAGFTFIELMLGLAISGMVGVGVAMMLGAISTGTRAQDETREASVKRQVAAVRVGALVRGAARVLAAEDDHLVLWLGGSAGADEVNLSELRRIQWDADAATLHVYEAPDGIDPDAGFPFGSDFSLVTADVMGTDVFPGKLVLRDVVQWESQLDGAGAENPPRLLRIRLTLDVDPEPVQASLTAALRATDDSDGGAL